MSCYTSAYLAKLNDNKQFELVGPFKKNKDGSFSPTSIWTRSRSFVPSIDEIATKMELSQMTEDVEKLLAVEGFGTTSKFSIGWYISLSKAKAEAYNKGFRSGYASYDLLEYLLNNNNQVYSIDLNESLIPTAVAAELPIKRRQQLGHTAYLELDSWDYLLNLITEFTEDFLYDEEPSSLYIIFSVC